MVTVTKENAEAERGCVERIRTRKDRKTVLALTAKERTAATEQTMRSDFKVSFCREKRAVV